MKALTLWQPWATLMAIGAKTAETRSWSTRYRGPLAIHAAKQFAQEERRLCIEDPAINEALVGAGLGKLRDLPLGALLCVVELYDVERTAGIMMERPGVWPPMPELAFGNYGAGRFAWRTRDLRRLPEPIPWRGQQGMYEVPDDVVAEAT